MRSTHCRSANFSIVISAAFALAAACDSAAAAQGRAPQAEESWQVIYIGESRVGYARTRTAHIQRDKRTLIRTESEDHIQFKRFGQSIQMEVRLTTEEAADGELLSFDMEVKNPPAADTRTIGRIEGNLLRLETTTGGRVQQHVRSWTPGTKSPVYADRLLKSIPFQPGQSLKFDAFEPALMKITNVKLTADSVRPVKLLDGREERLLRVKVLKAELPEVDTRMYLAADGRTRKMETGLMEMVIYDVPQHVALESIAGAELDLAVKSLIETEEIPNIRKARRIIYHIRAPGGDPSRFLASGPGQQWRLLSAEKAELTVTSVEPAQDPRAHPPAPEYLQSTRYLQSNDVRVADHARRAAAGRLDPAEVALRMERYVAEKLSKKSFSTALASAGEVARSLEGDCTEHAVLLAAMLRAQRIPSRIAVGLVYSEAHKAFAGHMWTEAYLGGEWFALDATRGWGGIGPGHIKLADSSFSEEAASPVMTFIPLMQALSTMQINVHAVE